MSRIPAAVLLALALLAPGGFAQDDPLSAPLMPEAVAVDDPPEQTTPTFVNIDWAYMGDAQAKRGAVNRPGNLTDWAEEIGERIKSKDGKNSGKLVAVLRFRVALVIEEFRGRWQASLAVKPAKVSIPWGFPRPTRSALDSEVSFLSRLLGTWSHWLTAEEVEQLLAKRQHRVDLTELVNESVLHWSREAKVVLEAQLKPRTESFATRIRILRKDRSGPRPLTSPLLHGQHFVIEVQHDKAATERARIVKLIWGEGLRYAFVRLARHPKERRYFFSEPLTSHHPLYPISTTESAPSESRSDESGPIALYVPIGANLKAMVVKDPKKERNSKLYVDSDATLWTATRVWPDRVQIHVAPEHADPRARAAVKRPHAIRLLKDQPVKIKVYVPLKEAGRIGAELDLALASKHAGDREEIELTRTRMPGGAPVAVYSHPDPVTIAEGGSGQSYRLNTEMYDVVRFAYGKSFRSSKVFDSELQRDIDVCLDAIAHKAVGYRAALRRRQTDAKEKEDYIQRLRVCLNCQHMMAFEGGPGESFTDYTRRLIVRGYNRMLNADPRTWDHVGPWNQGDVRFRNSYHSRYGVLLTSAAEARMLSEAYVEGRAAYKARHIDFLIELLLGVYEVMFEFEGLDVARALVMYTTGRDLRGRKASDMEIFLAAVDIFSTAASSALPFAAKHVMNRDRNMGRVMSDPVDDALIIPLSGRGGTSQKRNRGMRFRRGVVRPELDQTAEEALEDILVPRFRQMGMGAATARYNATVRIKQGMTADEAMIDAALHEGWSPQEITKRLGYSPDEIAKHLDASLQLNFGMKSPLERAWSIREALGAHTPPEFRTKADMYGPPAERPPLEEFRKHLRGAAAPPGWTGDPFGGRAVDPRDQLPPGFATAETLPEAPPGKFGGAALDPEKTAYWPPPGKRGVGELDPDKTADWSPLDESDLSTLDPEGTTDLPAPGESGLSTLDPDGTVDWMPPGKGAGDDLDSTIDFPPPQPEVGPTGTVPPPPAGRRVSADEAGGAAVPSSDVLAAGKRYVRGDGQSIVLGEKLGSGRFSDVYGIRGRPDLAIKFLRRADMNADGVVMKTQEMVERISRNSDLLTDADIPHTRVHYRRAGGTGDQDFDYVIVDRVRPERGMQTFHRPKKEMTSAEWRDQLVAEGRWTRDHGRAVAKLFDDLASKNIVASDLHIENLFFQRRRGKVVAGVLDHDRMGKWGKLDGDVNRWKEQFEAAGPTVRVHSTDGAATADPVYAIRSPHEFMGKAFEHNGWFKFNTGKKEFEPIFVDPADLDPQKFPIRDWVSAKYQK